MPRGLDDPDDLTPLFDALWHITGMSPDHDRRSPVARHGDDDGDHIANQADPDWLPDARDEHAHDDAACDELQVQPDRWVGVQRDPDALPIGGGSADGLGGQMDG